MLQYNQEELDSIQKISLEDLNDLVQRYKNGNSELLDTILRQFHPLIYKYTRIIKGCKASSFINHDTGQFLSLFLARKQKNKRAMMEVIDYLGILTQEFDYEDVYQQTAMYLLECLQNYCQQPGVNSLGYIVVRLRWRLHDWLKYLKAPENTGYNQYSYAGNRSPLLGDSEATDFHVSQLYEGLAEMDLKWVQESKDPLFKDLSRYERYLLYLSYKEGLSLDEMSGLLERDKDTVHRHTREVMKKLKKWAQA